MWLGGLESHLMAEALWVLMHINEIGYCHTPTTTLLEVKEHWKFFTINTKLQQLTSKVSNVSKKLPPVGLYLMIFVHAPLDFTENQ